MSIKFSLITKAKERIKNKHKGEQGKIEIENNLQPYENNKMLKDGIGQCQKGKWVREETRERLTEGDREG